MNIPKPLKTIQGLFSRQQNAIGSDLSKDFLKFGNRKPLVQDWSKVVMSDKDLYTGYAYAAINNRANKLAQLATENLKTDANEKTLKSTKSTGKQVEHPYLKLIDSSKTFSNYQFWYNISTFLDLEGVFYLLVIRNVDGNRIGNPVEFKLLNSYNVRRIRNKDTGEIGGYVEARDGLVRNIPPEMIIDIRNLNPFSTDDPYGMTDAAKEYQFTLKQAGDYTRHSLKNNMASPGIISTDMLLEEEQFKNFVARVTNQEKGLPLFGNGAGAVTWDAMQIDLDKSGLDKINEINRSTLMAVSGVSKTMMSIEESGTTRDTAKVQKDLFIEAHIMPQLQFIIDALNQDYKTRYEKDYEANGFNLYIDNPLGTDREAELKDLEIRETSFDLYNSLVNKGYKPELAAKYTDGEITLEELGQPTEQPKQIPPTNPNPNDKDIEEDDTSSSEENQNTNKVAQVTNQFDDEAQGLVSFQQSSLENKIINVEAQIVASVVNKLTKAQNAFEDTKDIMSKTEQKQYEAEMSATLEAFYLAIIPVVAGMTLSKRAKEFSMRGAFFMDAKIKKETKALAKKVGESHVATVLEDLRNVIKTTYDDRVSAELSKLEDAGRKVTDKDLALARKKALEGAGQQEIVSSITKQYTDISQTRAKTISRTESSRAFNQSQFVADRQFIEQNELEGRAYKKWTTFSGNPCPTCEYLASQAPIPFEKNFADLGETISSTYEKDGKTKVFSTSINFTPLESGNAHPNCSCRYVLIIK
jgi:hypothetical protein